jgi:uncharacterized delta-60 repeat protein
MNPTLFTRLRSFARLGLAFVILMALASPALAATGDLDSTFGVSSSGINFTDIGGANATDRIFALALQTDGKIVAAGESDGHFAVARYTTAGVLDTTFSAPDGTLTTPIEASSVAYGVAVQTDGKIVVAGSSNDGFREYFTVARYTSSGALDTAGFNAPTGYITTALSAVSDVATDVALQSDGKIVVGGYADSQFAVARYNTNGTLDTATFNSPTGFRTLAIDFNDLAWAIGLQSDGKIILAGQTDTGVSEDFAVARFTTSGALDTTFNGGTGYIATDFPTDQIDLAQDIAIQPDDKILVAGYTRGSFTDDDFALARYNANGTLDTLFGTSGLVITPIDGDDQAFAVAVGPTGRIVVAGTTVNDPNVENFALAGYTNTGAPNTNFGGVGYITTNVGDVLDGGAITSDFIHAAVIQSDNRIVLGGSTDHPVDVGDSNFAIARYESPNLAPGVTGFAKAGSEDASISFATSDFTAQFSDPDGDNLGKVKVTALPSNGTLRLSGVAVTAGQEISALSLGNLTYHPNGNYSGSDAFSWNGSDGLDYAAATASVDITLSAVNDAPVNTPPAAFSVNEDLSQPGLVFSIADVDAGSAANFKFTLSTNQGVLTLPSTTGLTLNAGSNGSASMTYQGTLAAINAAIGSVTYSPPLNYFGGATITLAADDNGNTGTGGALQDTDLVSVTVNPVNDAPSFTEGADVSVAQNSAAYSAAWASALSAGPANESGQTLSFEVVTNTNPALFSVLPAVAPNGTLTFTPAPATNGSATLTIRIKDNGGTANGGVDSSATQTLVITVTELFTQYIPLVRK